MCCRCNKSDDFLYAFVIVFIIFFMIGCSSSNNNDEDNKDVHNTVNGIAPTADAGDDTTVREQDVIQLNGSNSSDSDGTIQAYLWTQLSGPEVSFSNIAAVDPEFTAPSVEADTELIFELKVTDDEGLTDYDEVAILVINNIAPVADAGSDQTVFESIVVTLDGTSSSDVDGTVLTYQWSQLTGSDVTLNDADTATPNFTAPSITTDTVLSFELSVTDETGLTDTDVTVVTVRYNQPPEADAGVDQKVQTSQAVYLDASGSQDSDGSIVSYLWTQTEGASVENDPNFIPTSSQLSFTAPSASEKLSFELTVYDNLGKSSTDRIVVYVTKILFEDDFSQGLDTDIWKEVDDSESIENAFYWVISGSALEQWNSENNVNGGTVFDQSYKRGAYMYYDGGASLTDYRFAVEITPLTNGSAGGMNGNDAGIMFRYQDNDNYYRLAMNSRYGYTRLEKKVAGQFTTLAVNSIGYYDDIPMEFMVEVKGSSIYIYIDDDPVFHLSDSDLANGSIALYCQDKARFDNVLITDPNLEPRIIINEPSAYTVDPISGPVDLTVSAQVANLPSGAWVEFYLNEDTVNIKSDLEAPFTVQFTALTSGNYEVTAVLRDAEGKELDKDNNQAVGIGGGYYVAVGDSITNGSGDRYRDDNISSDGRTVAFQGYGAALNDKLTDYFSLPQIVFNEGIPGDTSDDSIDSIDSILERHANADTVLLLLGTNDAMAGVSATTFFDNMQYIVDQIHDSGKTVRYALVPPQLRSSGSFNTTINNYVVAYNNRLASLENAEEGPDLYSFFYSNLGLFKDTCHPNSLGHACISQLWFNNLSGTTGNDPFVLQQFQTPALYQQNLLEEGNVFYIDESYTLEYIPPDIASGIWIMTANSDAANADADYISFYLDRDATVYVAYDGQNDISLPDWLGSSFADTDLDISTTAGDYNVYARAYSSGTVVLGGNNADGGSGQFNYCVIVVKE